MAARLFPDNRRWTRHFVYRRERLATTWKFRISLVLLVAAFAWLTEGWWTVAVARSLVCEANGAPSDAIIVENFEMDNYLAFERAGDLRRHGYATRVLIPVTADDRLQPNAVALGTTKVLADAARVGAVEVIPVREIEPISLNTARDVLRFVQRERMRSVVVVSPYFRSRRSSLVYAATLGRAGITVACEPVMGSPDEWTHTWHGVETVVEQWLKLQYYRLYVLPFRART